MNTHSADFDIDIVLNTLETIADYFGQKKFVINKIFAYKLYRLFHPDIVDEKYLEALKLIGKRLDSTSELEKKRYKAISKISLSTPPNVANNDKISPGNNPVILSAEAIISFAYNRMVVMDNRKMNYFFLNDNDSNIFLNALAEYFVSGKFTLPNMVLQKHCKTKLCIALNSIYRYCRNDVPLNEYSGFIKFLKFLPAFKNQTNHQVYKSLKRELG